MPPHLTMHSKTTRGGRADRLRAVVELHHYKTLAARRGGRMGEGGDPNDPGQTTDDTNPPGGGGGGGYGNPVPKAPNQPSGMPATAYLGTDNHVHYVLVSGDYGFGIPPKFGQPAGRVSELQAANPGLDWTTLPAGFDLYVPDSWLPAGVLNYTPPGGGGGGGTVPGGGGTQIDVTPVVDPGTPAESKPWTTGQKVAAGAAGVAVAGGIATGVWWYMKRRKGRR